MNSNTDVAAIGPISVLFSEDKSTFALARGIEDKLGLTPAFHASRNLVEKLNTIVLLDKNFPPNHPIASWVEILPEIGRRGISAGWRRAAPSGRSKGHPLGGSLGQFAVASAFLQPVSPDLNSCFDGVLRLLLLSISAAEVGGFDSQANAIRLAFEKNTRTTSMLPSFTNDEKFRLGIGSALNLQVRGRQNKTDEQFVSALRSLLSVRTRKSLVRRNPGSPTKIIGSRISQPSPPPLRTFRTTQDISGQGYGGALKTLRVHNPEEETGESPIESLIFERDKFDEKKAEEGRRDDILNVDGRAEESRHWVTRHQKLALIEKARFTEFERIWFVREVIKYARSENQVQSIPAGLLLLVYCTGRSLEEVLRFRVGPKSEISLEGRYCRILRTPSDGYKPDNALENDIERRASKVYLSLPTELIAWINRHCRDSHSIGESIAEGIEQDPKKCVASLLEVIRDGGRYYRIRSEKIPVQLGIELTLAERNPIITHLLAGSDNHAPPMLAYYVALSTQELSDAYRKVLRKMMGSAVLGLEHI